MNILGLNAFHGDASAALVTDGQLVAAVEEERFNRTKHWAGFPVRAAQWCLESTDPGNLQHVAISRDPKAHLGSKIRRIAVRPGDWNRLFSRAQNSVKVARLASALNASGLAHSDQVRLHHVEHHRAHLASAFFASPFEEAAIVSIDGFGDFSSVMWGTGRGNQFEVLGSVQFPHSLGLFYTAFTQFLGFPNYGDEYKMMGLAAYGEPRFVRQVEDVVSAAGDQIRLNLKYFIHHSRGVDMTWEGGAPVIGNIYSPYMLEKFGPARVPHTELRQEHRDLAASVQAVLEDRYFAILNHVYRKTNLKKVCLAGGVALNCAANGKIFEKTPFTDVYIQAASNDAGTSIGAALYVWHQVLKQPRQYVMRDVYYGPEYSDSSIQKELERCDVRYQLLEQEQLIDSTARQIADGKVLGWFQGRMEFGPRALGSRSILADPRRTDIKDILNQRIKHREPFRPFCPSILAEATGDYFDTDYPSPFMLQAYKIKPQQQSRIPGVTHQDGTGRLQTVEKDVNPLYWKLLKRFEEISGVPVLINTSFNENEPIVNTPGEALDCFLRTKMDTLVMGSFVVLKSENMRHAEQRRAFAETAAP